jgi:hypothetical protein
LFFLPYVFVDAGDNLVMANDVAMLSNPPVVAVDKENFEEATLNGTPFDKVVLEVNVFQRPHEEKPSRRVVRIRVDRSAWDR